MTDGKRMMRGHGTLDFCLLISNPSLPSTKPAFLSQIFFRSPLSASLEGFYFFPQNYVDMTRKHVPNWMPAMGGGRLSIGKSCRSGLPRKIEKHVSCGCESGVAQTDFYGRRF